MHLVTVTMRKVGLLFYFLIVLILSANSQELSGKVIDENKTGIPNATITLLRSSDSSIIKYAITHSNGDFNISGASPGFYLIVASSSGFLIKYSNSFEINGKNISLPPIILSRSVKTIDSIQVYSTKPVIVVRPDKIVLNVESSISSTGSDVLELIRTLPGINLDSDDNISSIGKSGVKVYLDGKKVMLSGKDLSLYLKSLQSSQVEFIEVITAPSVKYEADGNAAIINIKLKRNNSIGTNGNVNIGYAVATFPKYNVGLSLNNRNKKTNIYGSINLNKSKNSGYFNFYREIADTIFDQRGDLYIDFLSLTYNAGIEYNFNKRNSIKFNVGGNEAKFDNQKDSKTSIYYQAINNKVKNLSAGNSSDVKKSNKNFSLNYQFADSANRVFSVDADLDLYNNTSNQYQPNYYYNPNGNVLLYENIYRVLTPVDINLFSIKADYEQNYKKGKLSFGAYQSIVTTKNYFDQFNVIQNASQLDSIRSNVFKYSENITSAYASYLKNFEKIGIYLGLRVENDVAKGRSKGKAFNGNTSLYDSSFTNNNLNLFPNFSISYKLDDNNKFSLSYSRRIDRPSYSDLNPFEYKLDEYTFQRGNTNLQPQFTNSIALNYIYKSILSATLNFSHVKDVFSLLTDTALVSKTFLSKRNLAEQNLVSLNLNIPLQFKRYSLFINANTYYSAYKANFGYDRELSLDVFSLNLSLQQSYKISKTLTAQVNGWFNSPTIWQGTFKSKSMGALDVGLQKTIFNGNGKLKLAVSDVFKTFKWSSVSNFAGQYFVADSGNESRLFKIDFSYRFGNSNMKSSSQRQNALEEERKRVQSSGVF